MSNGDRKRARRLAGAHEASRRWRETEASSPLRREKLAELLDYVSEQIVAVGHDSAYTYTLAWLAGRQIAEEPVIAFLRAHRMSCDFDLIYHGDPHVLFGPTAERLARMPLERTDFEALLEWLAEQIDEHGCDHSARFTREWLARGGFPVAPTLTALLALGGGCDCEVLMNVEAENIYPSAEEGVA
jgi:hypothetical protein